MATTHYEFDCYYQGGAALMDQTVCPLTLAGEPLLYTEARLVEDVVSRPVPWWLLILLGIALLSSKEK